MRSLQLQAALTEFIEAAAIHLQGEVEAGAEVPFEVQERSGRARSGGPALYCYHPLTDAFIAEHVHGLAVLPSYGQAMSLFERFEGLERYLASAGDDGRAGARGGGAAALRVLLADVFAEQTDFQVQPERLSAALARVERSTRDAGSQVMLMAGVSGLTISSEELALTSGLTLAQPHALDGLPSALAGGDCDLVVALALGEQEPDEALAHGVEVLRELLRALRLFGDGRLILNALAWAQVGGGAWSAVPLGSGAGRPHGMLVVTSEQEDELRAFCNLVSRRSPHGDELAWALRRYELGCERPTAEEGLSDYLLALRALLEPEGPASGLMPGRLAALCATPENRLELTERVVEAIALERAAVAGTAEEYAGGEVLVAEIAGHLRSLVRDVICGHLTPDLVGLADELLLEDPEQPAEDAEHLEEAHATTGGSEADSELEEAFADGLLQALAGPAPQRSRVLSARRSAEQVSGDAREPSEVVDLLI